MRLTLPILLLALFHLAPLAGAASITSTADGRVLSDEAYDLPPFEKAEGVDYFADRAGYERAAADPAFELREVWYSSGGLRVPAFVYRPRAGDGARLPVVVYNRGSYLVGRDLGYKLLPMFHRLAETGFLVVAPLYRGSLGAEGRDELGGGDLLDLMNVMPLLAGLPYADARNVFLYGESRGGVMTLMALRDGFPANAAATFGAFTDLDAYVRSAGPRLEELSRQIWPDFAARRGEIVRRRSAIYWPEKLGVPLLLMHGGADTSVDPSHSRDLAERVRRAGGTCELAVFEGDNHVLRANQEERDRRAAEWFRRYTR
jgi:dipeptidyl aminopeptidase/acylaminoacyl peptidase